MTPFDCMTLAMVTVEVPPFASVSTILPSDRLAVSGSPSTVVSVALPPPALIGGGDVAGGHAPLTT